MLPPKMNQEIIKNDSITIGIYTSFIKVDINEIYSVDEKEQEEFTEMIKLSILAKQLSSEELKEVERTHHNAFANRLKDVIDSGEIFDIVGAKTLPSSITKDRFFIITVNQLFHNRTTYQILFEEHDDYVWKVDFEIDKQGKLVDIICFNKSYEFAPKAIQLLKEKEKDGNLWR
jgi:hypothetical protein